MKYLDRRHPRYRAWAEDDQQDFENFHATYLLLVTSAEEKALGAQVGRLYTEFKTLGQSLMDKRAAQNALFARVAQNLGDMDEIIDNDIQPLINRQGADGLAWIEAVLNLEADIASVMCATAMPISR